MGTQGNIGDYGQDVMEYWLWELGQSEGAISGREFLSRSIEVLEKTTIERM